MISSIILGKDEIKRTYLIHLIDQYSDLDIIENTDSLKNLQNSIQNYSIDFIFLFDDFDEIDVFDLVNCWHSEIGVIMISKTPGLAAKCYAYRNIIDFLTLPLDAARFMKSVAKIYSTQPLKSTLTAEASQEDHLFVKTNKKLKRINYSDILFIEGLKDYILIRTLYEEYVVHANIGNFTNHLPRDRFMRIHKSYTIAIGHIKTVTSNEMEIGPHLIPIGRSYQEKTLSLLNIKKIKDVQ